MYNPTPKQVKALNTLLALSIVACIVFLVLHFTSASTLTVEAPADAKITINGNRVEAKNIKLRPATYRLVIRSPYYKTYDSTVRMNPYQTKTFKPMLTKLTPDDIATMALGTYGSYGPPSLAQVQWHEDNTWITAIVGPGSATAIALHYTQGKWSVGYSEISGYPSNKADLPSSVAQAIANLQTQEVPQ